MQNGGPFPQNWAVTSGINSGIPMCNGNTDTRSLDAWGSNRIVAMNYDMLSNNKAKWCGKEVQLFDASGKQITIDEGPFILWDGCAACASASIVDVSAKAFIAASGGTCGNNPEGITVKIIDNDLSASLGAEPAPPTPQEPAPAAPSSAAPAPSSAPAPAPAPAAAETTAPAAAESQIGENLVAEPKVAAAVESAQAAVESASTSASAAAETPAASAASAASAPAAAVPAPAPASPEGDCTFGAWRCSNLALQVCNYQTTTSVGWEQVAQCENECSFTETGSAICQ